MSTRSKKKFQKRRWKTIDDKYLRWISGLGKHIFTYTCTLHPHAYNLHQNKIIKEDCSSLPVCQMLIPTRFYIKIQTFGLFWKTTRSDQIKHRQLPDPLRMFRCKKYHSDNLNELHYIVSAHFAPEFSILHQGYKIEVFLWNRRKERQKTSSPKETFQA